jgi:mRNA interferase RelE/StbE
VPAYRVEWSSVAKKQLRKLTPAVRDRLLDRIDELGEVPRPPGCKKMKGDDSWRIRVGDYRVVYDIVDARLLVLVLKVDHRKQVYLYH